ncbi:hypothetical protein GIB67_036586 [Kingdonia uniflora]|uniref:Uncharacterized protein n=1 Tax=Kingdonia uniflora TaxID=39325 RepID=A0A7J7MEK7_9MAGN|nr:hypothetical protein GIB67_036586 [Kingdonia uniflora]
MSSIVSFLVFMSGEDSLSMGASSEPPTAQRKVYRPRGLQAPRDSCQNLRLGKPRITNPNLKPPCFALERMNRAIQKDLMLMDKDLDNDAVAIEYGADGNGHVRGYNGHLNKTNIRVSTPLRRVIKRERVKTSYA